MVFGPDTTLQDCAKKICGDLVAVETIGGEYGHIMRNFCRTEGWSIPPAFHLGVASPALLTHWKHLLQLWSRISAEQCSDFNQRFNTTG